MNSQKFQITTIVLAIALGIFLPNLSVIWLGKFVDQNTEWIRLMTLFLTVIFGFEIIARLNPETYHRKSFFSYTKKTDLLVFVISLILLLLFACWPLYLEVKSNWVLLWSLGTGILVFFGTINLFGTNELKAKKFL